MRANIPTDLIAYIKKRLNGMNWNDLKVDPKPAAGFTTGGITRKLASLHQYCDRLESLYSAFATNDAAHDCYGATEELLAFNPYEGLLAIKFLLGLEECTTTTVFETLVITPAFDHLKPRNNPELLDALNEILKRVTTIKLNRYTVNNEFLDLLLEVKRGVNPDLKIEIMEIFLTHAQLIKYIDLLPNDIEISCASLSHYKLRRGRGDVSGRLSIWREQGQETQLSPHAIREIITARNSKFRSTHYLNSDDPIMKTNEPSLDGQTLRTKLRELENIGLAQTGSLAHFTSAEAEAKALNDEVFNLRISCDLAAKVFKLIDPARERQLRQLITDRFRALLTAHINRLGIGSNGEQMYRHSQLISYLEQTNWITLLTAEMVIPLYEEYFRTALPKLIKLAEIGCSVQDLFSRLSGLLREYAYKRNLKVNEKHRCLILHANANLSCPTINHTTLYLSTIRTLIRHPFLGNYYFENARKHPTVYAAIITLLYSLENGPKDPQIITNHLKLCFLHAGKQRHWLKFSIHLQLLEIVLGMKLKHGYRDPSSVINFFTVNDLACIQEERVALFLEYSHCYLPSLIANRDKNSAEDNNRLVDFLSELFTMVTTGKNHRNENIVLLSAISPPHRAMQALQILKVLLDLKIALGINEKNVIETISTILNFAKSLDVRYQPEFRSDLYHRTQEPLLKCFKSLLLATINGKNKAELSLLEKIPNANSLTELAQHLRDYFDKRDLIDVGIGFITRDSLPVKLTEILERIDEINRQTLQPPLAALPVAIVPTPAPATPKIPSLQSRPPLHAFPFNPPDVLQAQAQFQVKIDPPIKTNEDEKKDEKVEKRNRVRFSVG